ncbi:MAG: hypothetical protein R6W31_20595 [Bacteroidales bacterium]
MKKCFMIPFGIMIMIVFACKKDENPAPTCEDGILNGNETGIDCGGGCDECFACTSIYCSLLSGATSNEAKTSVDWVGINANWKLTFYSDGKFDELEAGDLWHGKWKFDNIESPTRIKAIYRESELQGLILYFAINKFGADTLILNNGERTATFVKQ